MALHECPNRCVPTIATSGAILLSACCTSAHAYRPFESTDASVVGPYVIEIEFGPFDYMDVRQGSIVDSPAITINAGLSPRWELVADATRTIARSAATRDVETLESALLLKGIVREGVLQDKAGWSVATEFGALLPTRNEDDDYGATFAMIGSHRSERAVLHVNAAVSHNRDGNAEWFSGVILEGSSQAPVRPVAELTFEFENGPDTRSASALLGAIWEHADNLSFDIAVRAIREDEAWSYQGRLGLTWSFTVARS